MKKTLNIIAILTFVFMFILTANTYAVSLDAIEIKIDKTIVNPGEEVKVNIDFGENLGAYTFDVSYDNNIFEFVSVDGGTANDTTDKVKVVYFDTTGGTNPRRNMSVVFKAKENIITSNPTEFTVTATGLSNADASVTFDDITMPIVKNVTVEPKYEDYTLKLDYTGNIVKEKEKEMTISYSSPMGRFYEHARLIAEAVKPDGASAKLLAIDDANLEHDIIQSGWGDAQGYKIGGKDVAQVLKTRGIFDKAGNYKITLKLIDRDDSDKVIAEKTFEFNVLEEENITKPEENNPSTTVPEETHPEEIPQNPAQESTSNGNQETAISNQKPEQVVQKQPAKLPKAGNNIYIPVAFIMMLLAGSYVYFNKKK